VWEAVRNLVEAGTDVVLTTHYLDEADELADHVVVIDHGRTLASGTLAELKSTVGRDVIEVTLSDPSRLGEVRGILHHITSNQPRMDHSNRRASATATDGTGQLSAVIRSVENAGIPIDEIGLRRPTLDEAFLTLTGDHEPASVDAGQNGRVR
jgi:ABC-2 type transport system ATP-binding protein